MQKYDKHDDDRFFDELDRVMARVTAAMVLIGIGLIIVML